MSVEPIIPGVIRKEVGHTQQDAARWMRDAAAMIARPTLSARVTVGSESGNSRHFSVQVVNRDGVACRGIYAVLFWVSDTADGSYRVESTPGTPGEWQFNDAVNSGQYLTIGF